MAFYQSKLQWLFNRWTSFSGVSAHPTWSSDAPSQTSAGGHNTTVLQTEPPRDHIIWSLCCFLYSNPLCLGLAALIFSIKSRDRKVVGDLEGARHYGATARCLNIVATIIVCLTVIIAIVAVTDFLHARLHHSLRCTRQRAGKTV
uniref:Uncharacterized protein n=1 Tax=Oryzias latipes TaxID=8090 RepID=A0A3P9I1Q5_ORYLA